MSCAVAGLVDRMTPAELLDAVLAETAYGMEIREPRRLQARESQAPRSDRQFRIADTHTGAIPITGVWRSGRVGHHRCRGRGQPDDRPPPRGSIVFVAVNIGRGTAGVRADSDHDLERWRPAVAIADFRSGG
jgi:hypothetical protein